MKRFTAILLCVLALIGGYALKTWAGTTLVFGSPAVINNTTSNMFAGSIGQAAMPGFTLNVQSYGLTQTNAATFNLYATFTTNNVTNATLLQSWQLPSTNAGSYSLFPSPAVQSIYLFVQEITTNNVTNYVWITQ